MTKIDDTLEKLNSIRDDIQIELDRVESLFNEYEKRLSKINQDLHNIELAIGYIERIT